MIPEGYILVFWRGPSRVPWRLAWQSPQFQHLKAAQKSPLARMSLSSLSSFDSENSPALPSVHPALTKSAATLRCPSRTASLSGVDFQRSSASRFALDSRRNSTIGTLPSDAARCKQVRLREGAMQVPMRRGDGDNRTCGLAPSHAPIIVSRVNRRSSRNQRFDHLLVALPCGFA